MKALLFSLLIASGCASSGAASGALKLSVQCAGLPVLIGQDVAEGTFDVAVPMDNSVSNVLNCHIEMYKSAK